MQQVQHMCNWAYVYIDLICSKLASITPNIAYVTDQPVLGKTTKACQRGLNNLLGRGYGGSPFVGGSYQSAGIIHYDTYGRAVGPTKGTVSGTYVGTDGWDRREVTTGSQSFGGSGDSFLTRGEYYGKSLGVLQPHEELEPLEAEHPYRRLLNNPNPFDTLYDYIYEKWMFLLLCGVGYEWLVPDGYGTMPGERWVIPSHWVWPRVGGTRPDGVQYMGDGFNGKRDEGAEYVNPYNMPDRATGQGSEHLIDYYEIRPWGGMGSAGILKFPADQVVMTRFKSPLDKIAGWSSLAAGAQWIDLEESITKCRWSQFSNQARPELHIELGAGYEDPSDDQMSRYETKIMAKFQGEWNYGKPIFTPPGSKLTVLSFKPEEMGYIQSSDQVRDMQGSLFRVPKTAVGIVQDMTYGSILATLSSLCVYCLNPKLAMAGQTETKHVASRWDEVTPAYSTLAAGGHGSRSTGRHVRTWYDDCVPADPDQVNKDISTDATQYAITPNEIRALRGRKPYELGGDNPIGQGAGGPTPLAINVPEDVSELADIMAQMTQAQGDSPGETAEGQPEPQRPKEGAVTAEAEAPVNNLAGATDMADDAAGVAHPNGKPSKSVMKGQLDNAVEGLSWLGGNARLSPSDLNPNIMEIVNRLYRQGFVKRETDGSFRIALSGTALKDVLRRTLSDMGLRNKSLQKEQTGQPVAAGIALVAEDTGRVLMLQRYLEEGDENAGKWEFPGGKIDEGEIPFDSARREWHEETGMVLPAEAVSSHQWTSANGKYRGYVYRLPTESSLDLLDRDLTINPDGDRFEAVAWVSPEDFDNHNLRPALLDDLQQVHDALTKSLTGWVAKSWAGGQYVRKSVSDDGVPLVKDDIGRRVETELPDTNDMQITRAGNVRVIDGEGKTRTFPTVERAREWIGELQVRACVWGVFAGSRSLNLPCDTKQQAEAEIAEMNREGYKGSSLQTRPTAWDVVNRSGKPVSYYASDFDSEAEARSYIQQCRIVGEKSLPDTDEEDEPEWEDESEWPDEMFGELVEQNRLKTLLPTVAPATKPLAASLLPAKSADQLYTEYRKQLESALEVAK